MKLKMSALINDEKFQKTMRIYARPSGTKRKQHQTSNGNIHEHIKEDDETSYGITPHTPIYFEEVI